MSLVFNWVSLISTSCLTRSRYQSYNRNVLWLDHSCVKCQIDSYKKYTFRLNPSYKKTSVNSSHTFFLFFSFSFFFTITPGQDEWMYVWCSVLNYCNSLVWLIRMGELKVKVSSISSWIVQTFLSLSRCTLLYVSVLAQPVWLVFVCSLVILLEQSHTVPETLHPDRQCSCFIMSIKCL